MATIVPPTSDQYVVQDHVHYHPKPAISWAAIMGGVFATLATTLVLTVLGAGLGFAIRPDFDSDTAKGIAAASIIWMVVVQWIAASIGGYLAGRLRTRWLNVHNHEVYFRDTAHGFITWAVATMIMVAAFTSAGSMLGKHAHIATAMHERSMSAKATDAQNSALNPIAYYTDSLFRTSPPTVTAGDQEVRGEANRILMRGFKDNSLTEEDKTYLTQLVMVRTNLAETDARKRVDDIVARQSVDQAQIREIADNARKMASILSICLALSLLVGGFVGSAAAVLGGNIRDRHN
ncbi:MAG: hypothetical protein WAO98_06995 [Alphaproteobacteria bacterium]